MQAILPTYRSSLLRGVRVLPGRCGRFHSKEVTMKVNRFHQLPLFVTLLSATAWVGCAEDIQPEPSDPCPPEVAVITTDSTGTTRVGACSQENLALSRSRYQHGGLSRK